MSDGQGRQSAAAAAAAGMVAYLARLSRRQMGKALCKCRDV